MWESQLEDLLQGEEKQTPKVVPVCTRSVGKYC